MIKILLKLILDDLCHFFLHFRGHAQELALRDLNGLTHLHQRHRPPELGIGRQLPLLLRLAKTAVLTITEGACRLVILVPEEPLHLLRHLDFSALVMDGCIRRRRKERDRGGIAPALNALPQVARGYEDMPVASYRTFSPCPRLGEESNCQDEEHS